MGTECEHFEQAKDVNPITKGCEECEKEKTPWVAIRMCLHVVMLDAVIHQLVDMQPNIMRKLVIQ